MEARNNSILRMDHMDQKRFFFININDSKPIVEVINN